MDGIPWLDLVQLGSPVGVIVAGLYWINSRVDSLHGENVKSLDGIKRTLDQDLKGVQERLRDHEIDDDRKFEQLFEQSRDTHGAVEGLRADVRNLTSSINRALDATAPHPRR